MRIIAGKWKSRRLAWPTGGTTRPMPDRVKEAVFSALGSYFGCPAELPALRVADVFAGGGTLGLEALSRGAASCVFFERDREAVAVLRRNLSTLAVGPEGVVVSGDAWRQLARAAQAEPFGLILLDPPYRDSDDATARGQVPRLLAALAKAPRADTLIVLHYRAAAGWVGPAPEGWDVPVQRRFGTNGVCFLERGGTR
ncbi:MAG TPA: 16S rRNA (guanine(966)-N(2))-methyltransferase RsmD [Phycisphaerae bacterium]|nr:16S rRNA (guanine(966)-N(2))-methyltransferase RsmD [Phycisphaerae bacterium]HNU44579.1 16S rRNA (guanine(966)-N(2))-methyltransferase RsmD [Phycisphaerae bacterium]